MQRVTGFGGVGKLSGFQRRWSLGALLVPIALWTPLVGCQGMQAQGENAGNRDGSAAAIELAPPSAETVQLIAQTRSLRYAAAPGELSRAGDLATSDAVLRESTVDRVEVDGATLHPVAHGHANHLAQVTLAANAAGAFHVLDKDSGIAVDVTLRGGQESSRAEVASGYVVYPAGHASGADVIHRVTVEGTEDWLRFTSAPQNNRIDYDITLGERVAGLRLVSDQLELVDDRGAPRLRVAAPRIVGADGVSKGASLALLGCSADLNPAAPWGRSPVPAGANHCSISITWDGADLAYPALLDPAWSSTGSMADSRDKVRFASALLANSRVLAPGGLSNGASTSHCEIYDPSTALWAATGQLIVLRYSHTATALTDGRVLVAGGYSADALNTGELYDPTKGTWSYASNNLVTARYLHQATMLSSGKVLLTGGVPFGSQGYVAASELFDPTTNLFGATGSLTTARGDHTATLLPSNKVLVAGGNGGTALASAEIYDPTAGTFSAAGSLATARYQHAALLLNNGTVLATGGVGMGGAWLTSAEVYNQAMNTWTTTANAMTAARGEHQMGALAAGTAIVVGGYNGTTHLLSVELYDPNTNMFTATASMLAARSRFVFQLVGADKYLAGGGGIDNNMQTTASEIYDDSQSKLAQGFPCTMAADCQSGFCSTGYCCDQACTGACQTCYSPIFGGGTCRTADLGSSGMPSCGAYTCDGKTTTCPTTCSGQFSCAGGYTCNNNGKCTAPQNGALCGDPKDCASGNCIDGYCCDTTCTDQCAACNVFGKEGTCSPSTGNPVGMRASCGGMGLCQGQCGGMNTKACVFPDKTTTCKAAGCSNNTANAASLCDGAGNCNAGATTQCAAGCNGAVCAMVPPDMTTPPDLAGTPDLTTLPDLVALPDLTPLPDLTTAGDAAQPTDDLATAPQADASQPPDSAQPADLGGAKSDLATSNTTHDLANTTGADMAAAAPNTGCGCRVGDHAPDSNTPWAALSLLAVFGGLTRRRRARRTPPAR